MESRSRRILQFAKLFKFTVTSTCVLVLITTHLNHSLGHFRRRVDAETRPISHHKCSEAFDTKCCVSEKRSCPKIAKKEIQGVPYHVVSMSETFEFLAAGGSLARFGDGEVNGLSRRTIAFQESSEELSRALRFVAGFGGHPEVSPCLCIGTIPLFDSDLTRIREGPRRSWAESVRKDYVDTWKTHFKTGHYCDAYVSRPDAVDSTAFPSLGFFTPYWKRVFYQRRVLLVRGGNKYHSPATADATVFDRHLELARSVEVVQSFTSAYSGREVILTNSSSNIFHEYTGLRDKIIDQLQSGGHDVVVLSLGPTATVLAAELSCRGYSAIDVGQFGGNFSKTEAVAVGLRLREEIS